MSLDTNGWPEWATAPDGWNDVCADEMVLRQRFDAIQDARPVQISRFVRADGRNAHFGGEHFSVAYNTEEGRLDGLMNVSLAFTDTQLPTRDTAQVIAYDFLHKVAPDLPERLELRWVNPMKLEPENPPHDSPFVFHDGDGEAHKIVGQRVKFFDAQTNTWAWVIVGAGEQIISYERDIGWDGVRKRRTTEQWLHDTWVASPRQLGPNAQPLRMSA